MDEDNIALAEEEPEDPNNRMIQYIDQEKPEYELLKIKVDTSDVTEDQLEDYRLAHLGALAFADDEYPFNISWYTGHIVQKGVFHIMFRGGMDPKNLELFTDWFVYKINLLIAVYY